MDSHGMKFVPREVITDYRDRLYHGKPELNYKGIPYRQPKSVEKAKLMKGASCGDATEPMSEGCPLRKLIKQVYAEVVKRLAVDGDHSPSYKPSWERLRDVLATVLNNGELV